MTNAISPVQAIRIWNQACNEFYSECSTLTNLGHIALGANIPTLIHEGAHMGDDREVVSLFLHELADNIRRCK